MQLSPTSFVENVSNNGCGVCSLSKEKRTNISEGGIGSK
jgi:hypothetical protein